MENKKHQTDQTFRFRRVLGDILRFLKSLPSEKQFLDCQKQYESQLSELLSRGYTWGYTFPIPIHDTDFKTVQKKEWAAIRAIVKKQEHSHSK